MLVDVNPLAFHRVAPGFVITRIHAATLAAGPAVAGVDYYERTRAEISSGGFPASEAAELVCLLLEGVPFTGKIVSAQWDPWRDRRFHERLASDPSFATVRRIDGTLVIAAESGGSGRSAEHCHSGP